MDFFSQINEFKCAHMPIAPAIQAAIDGDLELAASHLPVGNSRKPPSFFLFHCGKGECDYSTWHHGTLQQHQQRCSGRPPRPLGQFRCEYCPSTFLKKSNLKRHIKSIHDWEPKKCPKCPNSSQIFTTHGKFKTHNSKCHSSERRICPRASECGKPEPFSNKPHLRYHLQRIHNLSKDEAEALIS